MSELNLYCLLLLSLSLSPPGPDVKICRSTIMGQSQEMLRFGVAMALCAVACSTCESTFVRPVPDAENCAATTMDRFSKQCNRKPSFASGYLDMVDNLSLTECGDLCLSRFACKSFTHIVGNGKCHLYAKSCKEDLN